MISHLYRFRPAEAVLDKYEELAKQEIYFSTPEELNDPMEGYKDVFWLGDRIVWRNLLRHYLLCLLQTASLCLVLGQKFNRNDLKTIIFSVFEYLPEAPVRMIFQRTCEAFFADPNVPKLVDALATRTTPLRRDELSHTLRAIHPLALSVLMKQLNIEGVPNLFGDSDELRARMSAMAETVTRVVSMTPADQEVAEALFAASELAVAQIALLQDYAQILPPAGRALTFLMRDFPVGFVRALDELLHPPCFVACFSGDPTNASMWATYGNGHTGVCLKFRTTADTGGRPALNLNGITGWRGGKGLDLEPVRTFHLRTFHKVNYTESYPEIDFFKSIGRLPIPILNAVWYKGEGGERSISRTARVIDTYEWRQKYWEAFQLGVTSKTADWAHEQEYRLLLWSSLSDLSDKLYRKLNYRFSDLSGVIFGEKTSTEHKLQIVKLVEDKCRAEGRTDFEFLQVQYFRRDRRFRVVPLRLIKFPLNTSQATDASQEGA